MSTPLATRAVSSTRPATGRPQRTATTGVIGALNLEWHQVGQSPLPHRWTNADPQLARFATLEDILTAIRHADTHTIDRLLHALLRLHAEGQQLAGRTVLQSMLGKAVRLSYTAKKRGSTDPADTAIEALWSSITTYPIQRTSGVAATLALAAVAAQRRLRQLEGVDENVVEIPTDILEATLGNEAHLPTAPQDLPFDALLTRALRWAHQHHVLRPEDIRMLARIHLADSPEPPVRVRRGASDQRARTIGFHQRELIQRLAAELGITASALRQRHARAVRTLAHALAATSSAPLGHP